MNALPHKTLADLRAEIDAIDDDLHRLLVARAAVIAQVPAIKGKIPVYIRPGREADMIRNLLARPRGHLPAGLLYRLWREMIGAFTQTEGRARVAVATPGGQEGYRDLARDFFGGLTPLHNVPDAAEALRQLRAGEAEIALLPWPAEKDAWWTDFGGAADKKEGLNLYAHLPFFGYGNCRDTTLRMVAIARLAPEATQADRTVAVFATPDTEPLRAALCAAGLVPAHLVPHGAQVLAEITGFHAGPDLAEKLPAFPPRWLGAYAVPLCPDHEGP